MKKALIPLLIVILLSPFMHYTDRQKPVVKHEGNLTAYSYEHLRVTFPSLKEAVSDVLYMSTCVLVGDDIYARKSRRKLSRNDWKVVIENVKVMNTLDRYYFDPYYFLGSYVPWNLIDYPGEIEKINQVLKEGMNYVKDWRIPFFIGFNYFYFLKDKEKGAKYLKIAASMEGSPYYLKLLVPRLYLETGKVELAISVTEEELKATKSEDVKKQLRKRLTALRIIRELDLAVKSYRKAFGKCPFNIKELKDKGFINFIPEDPYGGKFYLKKNCTVWTTSDLREKS